MAALAANLRHVLLLSAIPVGGELAFALLGMLWSPNRLLVSALQHLAAGVIAAAVALELIPMLLATFSDDLIHWVALMVGFCSAVLGFSLLSHFLPEQCGGDDDADGCSRSKQKRCNSGDGKCASAAAEEQACSRSDSARRQATTCAAKPKACCDADERCHAGADRTKDCPVSEPDEGSHILSKSLNDGGSPAEAVSPWKSLPWARLAPLAVDTFVDGLLLALASIGEEHAGWIIAAAFALETAVLGAMTSATLRRKAFSKTSTVLVSVVLCALFLGGAAVGCLSITFTSGALFVGFLAFGVASLLYLTIDHLLTEARENAKAARWFTKVQFYAGFLAVLIVHQATE